jgi:hypothetical protein
MFCLRKLLSLRRMIGRPLAGINAVVFSSAAGILALSTALIAGATRYGAVLADLNERMIERSTAAGFFLGLGLGLVALASEYAS